MSFFQRRLPFAIAFTVAIASANAGHASVSCKAAAQHLVNLVKSNWPSSDARSPGATADMMGLLNKSPTGFVPGATRFKLTTYSRQAFTKKALRLQKPFTPSGELLNALDDVQGALTVSELPGTDLLAANSIGGTANCSSTVFFSVSRGRTRVVREPESWKNDFGGSCGVTRSFASVDGVPVTIDDNLNRGPNLTSTLTLTPWGEGKWLDPCEASFVFAPRFDTKKTQNDWPGLNNWDSNDCGADGCEGFQRAALSVVKDTQQDRAGVEDHLLATMTGPERDAYRRLKRLAGGTDEQARGDDAEDIKTAVGLTDERPLSLPIVVGGHVFLATVGHFTIGWRVFSDWKVAVQAGEADRMRQIARFAIGMRRGPIVSAKVK
jgi:hypothetical protein